MRLALTPATGDESQAGKTASLFGERALPPHERKILKLSESRRSHSYRRDCGVAGTGYVVVRNIRGVVRAGAGGEGEANAGKKFCEELPKQLSAFSSQRHLAGETKMQSFKDLKVWEKAHVLTLDVYKSSKGFPRDEL